MRPGHALAWLGAIKVCVQLMCGVATSGLPVRDGQAHLPREPHGGTTHPPSKVGRLVARQRGQATEEVGLTVTP
jgi:hypothetical protein